MIAFAGALRGEELPLVDLYGFRKHFQTVATHMIPHIVIPLPQQLKRETGE